MTVQNLDRRAALLRALVDLAPMPVGDVGVRGLAKRILAAAQQVFDDGACGLALVDDERVLAFAPSDEEGKREPTEIAGVDLTPEMVAWLRSSADGPVATAWTWVGRDGVPSAGETLWSVQLVGDGAPIGVLGVGIDPLDPADAEILETLAGFVGTVVENARLLRELEREAETDGLTQVYNYRYFMRAVSTEMDRCRRNGDSLAVLMVDVDNLKEYNDRFGHLGGSAALKEMAEVLRGVCRSVDVVAKYGGDEFSVLLPSCSWRGAASVAERLRNIVEAHEFENDPARRLTVSVGVTVFPDEGIDPRDLLRSADERLYEAKRTGRNRVGSRP